jgi:hypothetical protein
VALSCFCTQLFEQISKPGSLWKRQLGLDEKANVQYMLQKPSSDSTPQFSSLAKELFGEKVEVQQSGNNHSGTDLFKFIQKCNNNLMYSDFFRIFHICRYFFPVFGLAAIEWRKKTFRKYFDRKDNFTEFQKLSHSLLEAPTVESLVYCRTQLKIG